MESRPYISFCVWCSTPGSTSVQYGMFNMTRSATWPHARLARCLNGRCLHSMQTAPDVWTVCNAYSPYILSSVRSLTPCKAPTSLATPNAQGQASQTLMQLRLWQNKEGALHLQFASCHSLRVVVLVVEHVVQLCLEKVELGLWHGGRPAGKAHQQLPRGTRCTSHRKLPASST